MPFQKSRSHLIFIYLMLFTIGLVLIYSAYWVLRTQRDIAERHAFLNENSLAHTESLNRLVFTLSELLSYDEAGRAPADIAADKTELCRRIVSNAHYIVDLPDLNVLEHFSRDPLLLGKRLEQSEQELQTLLAILDKLYAEFRVPTAYSSHASALSRFEETGRQLMQFLRKQNNLLLQFDDYIYTHLEHDIEDVSSSLRAIIIIQSILMVILTIVSLLYFSFIRRVNLELHDSRAHLEQEVERHTRDLNANREQLQEALQEREVLLREIHHRVKNNLAVINSIIELQRSSSENGELQSVLADISNRIHSIGLVHQKIYSSDSLTRIDFKGYAGELTRSLLDTLSVEGIEMELEMAEASLESDQMIPLGIILTELTTNALKYGFSGRTGGRLSLGLEREGSEFVLTVANDGHPFPNDVDIRESPSLGLQIVQALVVQLNGSIELKRTDGTEFVIRFPSNA